MNIDQVMSRNPACCTPATSLETVAKMMVENDCGEIPVVGDDKTMKPIGVITDRDIVCRAVARGLNPQQLTARECMSEPCVTVTPHMSIESCVDVMDQNRIRRVPVVNEDGCICGIVAIADLVRYARPAVTADVIKEVSEPTGGNAVHKYDTRH